MSTSKAAETKTFLENSISDYPGLKVAQQPKRKENLSIIGAHGRLYVQPLSSGYDVSLGGQPLEDELTEKMERLFGAIHGYKHKHKQVGPQPFWRVKNLCDVCKAIEAYAGTKK